MATNQGKTEFARRVKALGITLKEFAELSGYSQGTVYDISAGFRPMTARLEKVLILLEREKSREKDHD